MTGTLGGCGGGSSGSGDATSTNSAQPGGSAGESTSNNEAGGQGSTADLPPIEDDVQGSASDIASQVTAASGSGTMTDIHCDGSDGANYECTAVLTDDNDVSFALELIGDDCEDHQCSWTVTSSDPLTEDSGAATSGERSPPSSSGGTPNANEQYYQNYQNNGVGNPEANTPTPDNGQYP